MNELESILNYLETTSLEPHDDYTSEFTYKEQKLLWNYIKELKDEIERLKKELYSTNMTEEEMFKKGRRKSMSG